MRCSSSAHTRFYYRFYVVWVTNASRASSANSARPSQSTTGLPKRAAMYGANPDDL
jgi:hypothetical protein